LVPLFAKGNNCQAMERSGPRESRETLPVVLRVSERYTIHKFAFAVTCFTIEGGCLCGESPWSDNTMSNAYHLFTMDSLVYGRCPHNVTDVIGLAYAVMPTDILHCQLQACYWRAECNPAMKRCRVKTYAGPQTWGSPSSLGIGKFL
jgi:hypothetical protein